MSDRHIPLGLPPDEQYRREQERAITEQLLADQRRDRRSVQPGNGNGSGNRGPAKPGMMRRILIMVVIAVAGLYGCAALSERVQQNSDGAVGPRAFWDALVGNEASGSDDIGRSSSASPESNGTADQPVDRWVETVLWNDPRSDPIFAELDGIIVGVISFPRSSIQASGGNITFEIEVQTNQLSSRAADTVTIELTDSELNVFAATDVAGQPPLPKNLTQAVESGWAAYTVPAATQRLFLLVTDGSGGKTAFPLQRPS